MRLSLAAAVAGLCAIYVAPQAHSEPSVIPPVSAAAAAVGFVDVRAAVPDAVIDLRYATAGNFVAAAAEVLRAGGERLVFWDCYRPHSVQVRMFDAVPDPNWVAEPGAYSKSHESGRSVDVTLYGPGGLVDMGTGFDDFTARANAYNTAALTDAQVANRARLRDAMAAGGLAVYSGEWWHFDGPGAGVPRPIIDVPVN